MHSRRRKKLMTWLWIFIVLMLILYAASHGYSYVVIQRLKAKLKPGEYVVDLGAFSVDDFLMVHQPNPLHIGDVQNFTMEAMHKSIPDTRPLSCRSLKETDHPLLTSIIIVYHNEPRVKLITSVYSILLRSPPTYLSEIILIDDASDDVTTGEKLQLIPKVKVFRNQNYEGLIKSFNIGGEVAQGPVLTFLQPNCIVNVGWLQPLADRLSSVPLAVVTPVLDKFHTIGGYSSTEGNMKGGFDWSLVFKWDTIKSHSDNKYPKTIRSPVFAGSIFSIRKDRFLHLGSFDSGLELSGGENFELSFKNWLCGGVVEIITCSHVGVYGLDIEIHGIIQGKENIYFKNIKRIAEVWMDDYKRFFYYTRPSARMINIGKLMERKSLRKNLKCQSFKWYLDNVYTDLRLPMTDEILYGNIRQDNLCVDVEIGHVPAMAKLTECNIDRGTQDWSFKKKGEISNGGMCLTAGTVETHGYVMIHFCTKEDTQKWQYVDGHIYKDGTNLCLDSHKSDVGLVISPCDELFQSQKWNVASKSQLSRNKDEV
ncbi:Polypeptide N-acetylgalactosaminyltransferase 14 [Mactra antiquata]